MIKRILKKFSERRGQSLMELLIGMAVGAVLIVGSAAIIASSLQSNGQVATIQVQAQLGEELLNNVKAWAAGNWNGLLGLATGTTNQYSLNTATSPFSIVTAATSSSSPTANGYSYTRSITVNGSQVSSTQTNFPMLFSGTYAWLAASSSGGYIQKIITAPNGGQEPADLVFTSDSGCITPLNFETESYTSSTGAIVDWVNVPTLASGTVIYACYGNSSVSTDQSHPSSTWNSNFGGVYHLATPTSTLQINDSTANANNGSDHGATTASTPVLGGGAQFSSASSNYITLTNNNSISYAGSPFTYSMWIRPDGGSSEWAISGGTGGGGSIALRINGGTAVLGKSGVINIVSANSLTTGVWNNLVMQYDSSNNAIFYINGVQVLKSNIGSYSFSQNTVALGADGPGGGSYFNGSLGEIHFLSTITTPSWILTEYNNQNSPSTFYTVGAQQAYGAANLNTYSYYRSITVNSSQVSSTQTNFPMLFSGTYSYLAASSSGGYVQNANGNDIIFTSDASGTNKLSWQVQSYTSSTGSIVAWVNIPTLTSSTQIYMFYGNSSINSFQGDIAGTWNSNYKAVYHLGTATTINTNDSTGNANNTTITGSPTATAGPTGLGGGITFGAGSFLVPSSISLSSGVYSLSTWFYYPLASSADGWETLFRGASDHPLLIQISTGLLGVYDNVNGTGFHSSGYAMTSLTTGWHYLDEVTAGTSANFYVDGSYVGASSFRSTDDIESIGNYQGDGGQQWGSADEIRVLNTALSSSWILTEYHNQSSPSTFYTIGSQQTNNGSSLNGYSYTRSITMNGSQVSSTQTNFPMLFSGTYSWLEASSSGGNIQKVVTAPNGGQEPADFIFTSDSGCTTPLNFETEKYASSTGAIVDWVKVPTLTSGTVIYACYGNSAVATDQSHPSSTWNANYVGVWHLPNGTTLNSNDSTFNANNGTNNGATATSGEIGGGAYIAGGSYTTASAINFGNVNNFTTASFSVSTWAKFTSETSQNYPGIISKTANDNSFGYSIYVNSTNNEVVAGIVDGSTNIAAVSTASSMGDSNFHYYTLIVNRSSQLVYLYVDGVSVGSSSASSVGSISTSAPLYFGGRNDTSGGVNPFLGVIDEVRISSIALSPSWILTEYNNQLSPSSFYSLGSAVTASSANSSGVESVTVNGLTYQRYFYVSDAYRDSSGNATSTASGNTYDPSTKQITVVVSAASSTPASTTYSTYVTRSISNNIFDQKNWAGGINSSTATFVSSTYAKATGTIINSAGSFQMPITYAYSRSITVTSTTSIASGTQTNFPMLFSGTYSWLAASSSGGNIQNLVTAPNGGQEPADLIFATSTANCGSANLNFETESYTPSTGAIADWVSVPSLSAGTSIYACYGNSAVTTDQSHPSSTWSGNYLDILHLSGNASDSTSNANNGIWNGTAAGSSTYYSGGNIGNYSGFFNGSNDYVQTQNLSGINSNTQPFSLTIWFKTNAAGVIVDESGQTSISGAWHDSWIEILSGGNVGMRVWNCTPITAGTATFNSWNEATMVFNGSTLSSYLNGAAGASTSCGRQSPGPSAGYLEYLNLGAGDTTNLGSGAWLNGLIGEFHVVTTTLSAPWILTEYNNQNSPNTFYTVGSAVLNSSTSSSTLDSQPFDTGSASGTQINAIVWHGSQPSGTSVGFQFAMSNSSVGPWSYVGPDGTTSTYFSATAGTPINLLSTNNGYATFSGYRYFSYRTFLNTSSTAVTPVVSEVSVNWSP